MHRVGACARRGGEDLFGIEVALGRGAPVEGDGLIRLFDERRIRVRVGVDRDTADAHAVRRSA